MADTLTGSPFHEAPLNVRSHHLISEIDESILETSRSIALDREAPFDSGKEGSSVPLASPSDVGTQSKSRVRVRSPSIPTLRSDLERREGES
eukprot:3897293-Pleurochrysis_carterae.AAC.1